jgi:hypothetical protein
VEHHIGCPHAPNFKPATRREPARRDGPYLCGAAGTPRELRSASSARPKRAQILGRHTRNDRCNYRIDRMKNHMKNLTCLTTWLVVVAPLICGLGCGASTQTSHYEYLPTNHQDTQAGDAYKNNRSEKFKYFKYNVSFNLANDKDMEFLIKIEKCNGSTCEPIKGKAIYIRDSMTCEADSFEFFGISDETGSAKKHPGWFDGQQFCMGGVTPSDKVIYISNKIQSSKFEKQQNLSKGDTCPGKKDIIVGATPSVQASLDRRKEEIENHKQFISDLIHVGTISSFGKEFSQRCNSLADKKLQATLENFRNENSSTAEILIAKCKSSPDDNNSDLRWGMHGEWQRRIHLPESLSLNHKHQRRGRPHSCHKLHEASNLLLVCGGSAGHPAHP